VVSADLESDPLKKGFVNMGPVFFKPMSCPKHNALHILNIQMGNLLTEF